MMTNKININSAKELQVSVMEIERFAIHDGPGIRTVVFLQGCPLHCLWCSNPESQPRKPQLFYMENKCVACGRCMEVCPSGNITFSDNHPVFNRRQCADCHICVDMCPQTAIRFVGKSISVLEIMQTVLCDFDYYTQSGGGVTFSGGEAFLQFDGLMALLLESKKNGLHTAVETCGQVPIEYIEDAFHLIDLFLFDIKHTDKQKLKQTTGGDFNLILNNLNYIASQDSRKVVLRVPCIPGFNVDNENLHKVFSLAKEKCIKNVYLLPYHTLGKDKYLQMGLPYPYPVEQMMRKEELIPYRDMGKQMGLNVFIGG